MALGPDQNSACLFYNGLLLPSVNKRWSLQQDVKKTDTVAELEKRFHTIEEMKTITMKCPSNNSRNTISAVTVITPLSAPVSLLPGMQVQTQHFLRPNVCFIWAFCLKHTCG